MSSLLSKRYVIKCAMSGNNERARHVKKQWMKTQVNQLNTTMIMSSYEPITVSDLQEVVYNKWQKYQHIDMRCHQNYIDMTFAGNTSEDVLDYTEIIEKLNQVKLGRMFLLFIIGLSTKEKRDYPINYKLPIMPSEHPDWSSE